MNPPVLVDRRWGKGPAAELRQGANRLTTGCGSLVARDSWLDSVQSSSSNHGMPISGVQLWPASRQLTWGAKVIEVNEA